MSIRKYFVGSGGRKRPTPPVVDIIDDSDDDEQRGGSFASFCFIFSIVFAKFRPFSSDSQMFRGSLPAKLTDISQQKTTLSAASPPLQESTVTQEERKKLKGLSSKSEHRSGAAVASQSSLKKLTGATAGSRLLGRIIEGPS